MGESCSKYCASGRPEPEIVVSLSTLEYTRSPAEIFCASDPDPGLHIDRQKAESVLNALPKRESSDLLTFLVSLRQESSSLLPAEEDRAWLAFRWVAANIVYDAEAVRTKNYGDVSPEAVFRTGKTVCSGYARLYERLASEMKLKVERVAGWCKGVGHDPERPDPKPNHEWNAVWIESLKKWFLVDPTWGSGCLRDGQFFRDFEPYYFCTDPHRLIRSHFPSDPKWQLLDPQQTREEYNRSLRLEALFYSSGLLRVEPDAAVLEKASGPLKVYFAGPSPKTELSAKLEVDGTATDNSTFVQRRKDHFEILFAFPRTGRYDLTVFARKGEDRRNHAMICKFRVMSGSDPGTSTYPKQFPAYNDLGAILHSPLGGGLTQGERAEFRLTVPGVSDVAVKVGPNYHPLARVGGSSEFTGKLEIDSASATVLAKPTEQRQSDTYLALLEYQVATAAGSGAECVRRDPEVLARCGIEGYPRTPLIAFGSSAGEIKFRCVRTEEPRFSATLCDPTSGAESLDAYTFVQIEDVAGESTRTVSVDIAFPSAGKEYLLRIFARRNGDPDKLYAFALEYRLICNSDKPVASLRFVKPFDRFHELSGVLFEPKAETLLVGSAHKFSIKLGKRLAEDEDVVLVQGEEMLSHLRRDGDRFDTDEPIIVKSGNDLLLCTLDGKSHAISGLVRYKVG